MVERYPDNSIKMGKNNCPSCNYEFDCVTSFIEETAVPEPLDITICAKCASILQYTHDMDVQLLPQVVIDSLPESTKVEIETMQLFIKIVTIEKEKSNN